MDVYILTDSAGEIRYVGETDKALEERLKEHLWPSSLAKPGHKNNWIKALLAKGEKPQIFSLQKADSQAEMDAMEDYYINLFRSQDYSLVNDRGGGEGMKNPSLETRARMSAAKKGKPSHRKGAKQSEAAKEKIRQANIGKKASAETKNKMSASHLGNVPTNIEFLRINRIGTKINEEQRQRMCLAAQKREALKRQSSSSEVK